MSIVLGMPFSTLSNVEIDFSDRELSYESSITTEILPTTKQIELIGRKKFAAAALSSNKKIFVVYVAALNFDHDIHLSYRAQLALFLADNVSITVSAKYADFADIFSPESIAKLPKYTGINNHLINLVGCQQLFYKSISSLKLVELETLKTYIKINLANGFIQAFKLLAEAFIPFL